MQRFPRWWNFFENKVVEKQKQFVNKFALHPLSYFTLYQFEFVNERLVMTLNNDFCHTISFVNGSKTFDFNRLLTIYMFEAKRYLSHLLTSAECGSSNSGTVLPVIQQHTRNTGIFFERAPLCWLTSVLTEMEMVSVTHYYWVYLCL